MRPVGAAAEVDWARRDQHAHSPRRCAGEGGDHLIAFNRRSTLPRTARSTPALTARLRCRSRPRSPLRRPRHPPPPARSGVLACRPRPSRRQPPQTRTLAASHRVGCDAARNSTRSRSPARPVPGFPRQDLHATETLPIKLANYLAHHPPGSIKPGKFSASPPPAARWGSGSAYRRSGGIIGISAIDASPNLSGRGPGSHTWGKFKRRVLGRRRQMRLVALPANDEALDLR